MQNENKIPYFTYTPSRISKGHAAWIEMDGQPIHEIKNLDAFYTELGYTAEMRMAGVVPDEFIWDEYTKDNRTSYASCLQMHLIEYLVKNSIGFLGEYGNQYKTWFDNHIEAATDGNISCAPCRGESFCNIGMSILKFQLT